MASAVSRQKTPEDGLTYKHALGMVCAMKTASRDVDELQKEKQSVHRMAKYMDKPPRSNKPKNPSRNSGHHKPESFVKGSCFRCKGTNHIPADCYFKDATCHQCKGKWRIKKACTSKKTNPEGQKGKVYFPDDDDDDDETFLGRFVVKNLNSDAIGVKPEINGTLVDMELEPGSPVSIIPANVYKKHFVKHHLEATALLA